MGSVAPWACERLFLPSGRTMLPLPRSKCLLLVNRELDASEMSTGPRSPAACVSPRPVHTIGLMSWGPGPESQGMETVAASVSGLI